MIRSALGKVLWLGRATSAVVGLAVVLALVVGVSSAALAGNLDPLKLGTAKNVATRVTTMVGKVATGSAFVVKNPSGGSALELSVGGPLADPAMKTVAPMKVDSQEKVANLNADELDGRDADSFVTNFTYRAEDPQSAGTLLGDGTRSITKSCQPGDRMLSGGPANIRESSDLLESYPASTTTWAARINPNGLEDNWNVVVLCAPQ